MSFVVVEARGRETYQGGASQLVYTAQLHGRDRMATGQWGNEAFETYLSD